MPPELQRDEGQAPPRMPARLALFAALLLISAVFCLVALSKGWIDLQRLVALVRSGGAGSMWVYIVAVFSLELLWMPRMWGLLAAGLLFGPLMGMALSLVADLSSGVVTFLAARFAGAAYVEARLRRHEGTHRLVELLARERGVWTLFLLRALPVPYTAVGYAAGLADVPWRKYALGTLLGTLPGALLYPLAGDAVRDPNKPAFWIAMLFVLATILLGIYLLGRFWRRWRASDGDGAGEGQGER